MKIGFIGVGRMGASIILRLLSGGHQVVAWNRTASAVDEVVKHGAVAAKTPEQTLEADVLLSILANDQAMRDVGLDGALLDRAPKGLVHSNMATISYAFAKELAAAHASRGIGYVGSTVFGRPDAAARGELVLVAAGETAVVEKLRPIYELYTRRIAVLGTDPAEANLFKIAGNLMIAAALEAMGETHALLKKGGVDPAVFHDVLSSTLFSAPIYKNYGALIVAEKYEPAGFALKLGKKDAGLALAAAKELNVPLPLADLVHAHYEEAIADGLAESDWSAIAKVIAKHAGV
jgi:3-hydroxyisobutyrate dehydrogenase-like beta-hydroxyacid dehydrogenase